MKLQDSVVTIITPYLILDQNSCPKALLRNPEAELYESGTKW